MKNVYYVTGNPRKVEEAQKMLSKFDINVEQIKLDIEEIQSDSFEDIALNKARQAYEQVKKPLFVNDSGWLFTALKGFPGPYMKYVNKCFEPEDFISLLSRYKNKEVILRETIVLIDENGEKVFTTDHIGKVVAAPKGEKGVPSDKVISLSSNGLTISEEIDTPSTDNSSDNKIWENFGNYLVTLS